MCKFCSVCTGKLELRQKSRLEWFLKWLIWTVLRRHWHVWCLLPVFCVKPCIWTSLEQDTTCSLSVVEGNQFDVQAEDLHAEGAKQSTWNLCSCLQVSANLNLYSNHYRHQWRTPAWSGLLEDMLTYPCAQPGTKKRLRHSFWPLY